MDALTALHTRLSVSQLDAPAPTAEQLDNILKAGLRASDHGRLRPWKFVLIEGEARHRLGELFVRVALKDNPALGEDERKKLLDNPLRAPLVIIVVAKVRPNEKIPAIEQTLSAAGAAQLMLLAAHAQGLGAVWKTGKMTYHPAVHQGLGLEDGDQIIGFLYMGTPKTSKPSSELDTHDFVSVWKG
jgi:nitroreductase